MKVIYGLSLFILAFTTVSGQKYQSSLDMRIPFSPDVVTINGKPTVYYELHLTSSASDSIRLSNLDIYDPTDSTVVISYNGDDLKKRSDKKSMLPPGASCVIYLEFDIHNKVQLVHHIKFEHLHNKLEEQGAPVQLSKKAQLVIGSPLSAGPWAAVYDPAWQNGHRRVIFTVDGKARIPGRFAIDFIRLNDQGKYAKGNDDVVKNWYGYEADVLAVADGIVASTRDDFPESLTISGTPSYTADKATGNYISIDIGNNNIVFYEHLKPGSIKVKPGQRVKKGSVIASLGFTGQSTGPHLHFHVANANSPLGAEGIPFVFEQFTLLGSYPDFESFGKTPWVPRQMLITKERPASNTVVNFNSPGQKPGAF